MRIDTPMLLLVGLLVGAPSLAADGRPPNVLIYLVDTLRADHLGVYGYERDTSPVLDAWAARAVVFDQAYAPSSWTKPSMVSLLTGLDPFSHGVEDRLDVIPANVTLLGQRLKARGYATHAAVTNPNVLPMWGFGRGYDAYVDIGSAGHDTRADAVSDHVLAKLPELAQRQPFLLYAHVLDPHGPFDPPPPYDEKFPKSPHLPPERAIGNYDGEIAFVDAQFGRILEGLDTHGLAEDTMVVFVADHGEELLDHGAFGHGYTLYQEVVAVPLVVRFPGSAHAGERVAMPVTLADVVPTILAAIGAPPAPDLDGRDLAPLVGGSAVDRDLFLSVRTTGENSSLVRGVVSGSHKYVRRSRPKIGEDLFDLETDPREKKDLARARDDVRARLADTLDAQLARKASGIHLRLLNAAAGEPVPTEVRLTTEGRFVDVSPVRLEDGDRHELSSDGKTLTLVGRLENRTQRTLGGPRSITDEDGLFFQVRPADTTIVVERATLPVAVGAGGERVELPFRTEVSAAAMRVRDEAELLGPAATRGGPAAYLGVVGTSAKAEEVSDDLVERLEALGYVTDEE